jgi:nucleotide-binding universal stress UspA family protein
METTVSDSPTLLLCYDGSDHAKHAVDVAAKLFPGATATVVHVWEPLEHIIARYAALSPYLGDNIEDADTNVEQQSSALADEGAKLATDAGLVATPHAVTLETTVWEAVAKSAEEQHADLIVTGTRSLHGARELFAGTLSHALLQHCPTPLLAVPTPADE